MTFWKKQNYKDQWLPRVEEMNRQSTEDFYGSESILHTTNICRYTYVKTHRMCNTKYEPV